jgi:hypothetical protein
MRLIQNVNHFQRISSISSTLMIQKMVKTRNKMGEKVRYAIPFLREEGYSIDQIAQ